jgi:hypothetical protein
MLPVALKAGPDGALYIAQPALKAADGSGQIVRVELATGMASPMAGAMEEAPSCAGTAGAGMGTPAA